MKSRARPGPGRGAVRDIMEGTSPGPGDIQVLNQIASPYLASAPMSLHSPDSPGAGHASSWDGMQMGDGGLGSWLLFEAYGSASSRWRNEANSLDMRVAAREQEARSRVETLIMARDARREQMERSHNEARMLYAEAVEKGRALTSRARITPARNDKLLVVTSLEDGHHWKQTTYYPTKRYHIDNVTYSRSQRRRDVVAGRTPTSRGFTVRSNISTASRNTLGAENNFLAVSTPVVRSRRSTCFSHEQQGYAPSWSKISPSDHGSSPRSPWGAASSSLVDTANTYGTGTTAYAHRRGADEPHSRVSSSRRPPRGTEKPLIFPRHRPGAMPTHSNPLLAVKLRVKDVVSLSSPRRGEEVMMRWDGSQTERVREKPGLKGGGGGRGGFGGGVGGRSGGYAGGVGPKGVVAGRGSEKGMAAWVKVADVVPISPRRKVAGYICDPTIKLKRPAGDPEYIPVVTMGEEPGSSGFRLRHMGPCKGGIVLNEVHAQVHGSERVGQQSLEGRSVGGVNWQGGGVSVFKGGAHRQSYEKPTGGSGSAMRV